jgi:large subunit ribosomal protein L9
VKVVMRSDVENVGNKGDIVDVADGYGRNFLIRKGFAIPASAGAVAQAESMRRNRAAKDAKAIADAEALGATLTASRLTLMVKAGEGGKLFGSVGNTDIAAALTDRAGQPIDRKTVQLTDHIKELGAFDVPVKLHPSVTVTVGVDVVAE